MKSVIGSGLLGVPDLFKEFGLVPSLILFILIFLTTFYTSTLLIKSKNLSGRSNFCTIGNASIGSSSKIIISLLIILLNIGVCMAELVIFGSSLISIVNFL